MIVQNLVRVGEFFKKVHWKRKLIARHKMGSVILGQVKVRLKLRPENKLGTKILEGLRSFFF